MSQFSELFNSFSEDKQVIIGGLHTRLTYAWGKMQQARDNWAHYNPEDGYLDANMRPLGPQPDELELIGALARYALETGVARDPEHLLAQVQLADIRAAGKQGALDAVIAGTEALRLQHEQIRIMGGIMGSNDVPQRLVREYLTNKVGLEGIGRALVERQPLLSDPAELLGVAREQMGVKPTDALSAQALKVQSYVSMGQRSPFASR